MEAREEAEQEWRRAEGGEKKEGDQGKEKTSERREKEAEQSTAGENKRTDDEKKKHAPEKTPGGINPQAGCAERAGSGRAADGHAARLHIQS